MPSGRFKYRRAGTQAYEPWFRLGPLEVTTAVLVAGLCVVSLFLNAIQPAITEAIGIVPGKVLHGQLWRIATWPFANFPTLSDVIAIAAFWYFGSKLEALLGRRRFLALVGLLTVIPGMLFALLGLHAFTIGAISFAMFLAFVIENPNAPFFFGIKAWVIASVYLLITLLSYISVRQFDRILLLFVGLGLLVTSMRAWGLATNLAMFPKLPWVHRVRPQKPSGTAFSGDRGSSTSKKPKSNKPRRLRSVSNDETSKEPKPPAAWPSGGIRQEEVDRLLEKIASSGIGSLTADERRTLDLASKNLRERRE
jgi:membrane associated rhomboid family serine protease